MQSMREASRLPDALLSLRNQLPDKPNPVSMSGRYVRLEPLCIERDASALFEASNGSPLSLGNRSIESYDANELIWRHMFDGPFKTRDDLIASLTPQVNASHGLCLCIFDLASGQKVLAV